MSPAKARMSEHASPSACYATSLMALYGTFHLRARYPTRRLQLLPVFSCYGRPKELWTANSMSEYGVDTPMSFEQCRNLTRAGIGAMARLSGANANYYMFRGDIARETRL